MEELQHTQVAVQVLPQQEDPVTQQQLTADQQQQLDLQKQQQLALQQQQEQQQLALQHQQQLAFQQQQEQQHALLQQQHQLALQQQQQHQQLAAQQQTVPMQHSAAAQQQLLSMQQQQHAAGKASGKIQMQHHQYSSQGIPGLTEAVTTALRPVAHLDHGWSLDEMVKRVQSYFTKAAKKYETDGRTHMRGTAVDAQALIEEFVGEALHAVHAACYDKAWCDEADFSGVLMVAVMHTFRGGLIFCRTLGPLLKRYVDDGVLRFKEEERLQKVLWDATSMSGLSDSYHKRICKNLQASFDEAHMSASYGKFLLQSPELGRVQAFVIFWMEDFASKSWDMFEGGLRGGREEQRVFLSQLFQYLTDPERSVIPQEVVGESVVPRNWPFIEVQAAEVLRQLEMQPFKKRMRF